ncbi:putative F-box/FBD/LRR-repeat protein At1g78760 [Nicotiana tabacum]|uniref:F-box/FBD/LRR-repeat protein At1g78760 n=1 Tax=Nicotiana tabacum TaxID=4097 RepID=A0A1S3ZPB5_TOBAC|nr:PREDICTED: putative F-box/FBD/LRR-repeat protein At1g78760 isoform X2 [Nicotiana tabacum]
MPRRRKFLWKTPKYPNSHEIAITETTVGGHDIACVDRISNLPVKIIREIFFRVHPKDAARASVWSKRWLRLWASLSDIYLENGEIGMLFLRITVDKNSSCELLVKKWINFAIENKDIIFPDELTETLLPPIHDIKNLELQIYSSTATSQKILDGFIWILPGLRTLSLTFGSIAKIIEFQREDDVEVILARALARVKIGSQAKTNKR